MATQNIMGLFGMAPQDIQASRMADMQRNAMAQAQLSPMQLATYGAAMSGQQLGGLLRGALGGQDPEEVRALEVNKVASQIEWNDPKSIMEAARQLSAKGFTREAIALMGKAQEAELNQAKVGKETAEAAAKLREGVTTEQKNAAGWADTVAQRGTPEWAKAYGEKLNELTTKEGARINYGNEAEIVSRAMFGKNFNDLSQQEAAEVQKRLETMGVTKAKAGATNVSQVVTNKAAEQFGSKFGQLTGEQAAQVEGKYSALDYIGEAKSMLDKGIYAGQWGPEKLLVAKATAGLAGDIKKAENTEQFLAYVGNIVIPRLQEFGGNDSVEELRYLQRVVAGDQRLEANSMKAILDRAERAINRGIERIKRQAESIGAGGTVPLDAGPSRNQPKPTMRWNPQTKTLEKVQ